MTKKILVTACFAMLSNCLSSPSASSKDVPNGQSIKKVWRIEQVFAYGKQTVYVCDDNLRIDFPEIHCYLIAKSPTWQVVFYNTETKKAVVFSYKDYLQHPLSFTYFPAKKETGRRWPSLFAGHEVYAGTKVSRYVLPADPYQKTLDINGHIIGQFLIFNAPSITTEASEITTKLFKVTSSHGGIPLCNEPPRLNIRDSDLLPTKNLAYSNPLKTFSVIETTTTKKLFEYPVNFKRVTQEVEVSQSGEVGTTVSDLLDDSTVNKKGMIRNEKR